MEFDFSLTSEEKRELVKMELKEDYYDLWKYKGIIAFVIPLIVFYIPLNLLNREGFSEDFVNIAKVSFVIYGVIAYALKGIEIAIRRFVYKKRQEELISEISEDEQFHLEVGKSTIILKGKEEKREINMSEIIDVLEIDGYLAICYGQYGEYIFIPLKDFKDGRLYDLLASINTNLKCTESDSF